MPELTRIWGIQFQVSSGFIRKVLRAAAQRCALRLARRLVLPPLEDPQQEDEVLIYKFQAKILSFEAISSWLKYFDFVKVDQKVNIFVLQML